MNEFFDKVEGAIDWLYNILAKFITLIEDLKSLGSDEE